jgi:hypothetical protein
MLGHSCARGAKACFCAAVSSCHSGFVLMTFCGARAGATAVFAAVVDVLCANPIEAQPSQSPAVTKTAEGREEAKRIGCMG